jgi:hypothetical protein
VAAAGADGSAADDGGAAGEATDLGSQLMRLVARACEAGLDPEIALRSTVRAYAGRIRDWEQSAP